jgi:hypothetical protein
MANGTVVNVNGINYVCAWRGDQLLITDEARNVRFNGPVAGQLEQIGDVKPGNGYIWVFGSLSGVYEAANGFARINCNTWQVDPPGAVMGR